MSKTLNLVARVLLGIASIASPLKAETLDLKLNASFVGSSYTQDSFNARVDSNNPNISNGYDANDIVQQPNLTDLNFIQAYTTNTGYALTEDYKVFDPNETYWDIRLMAEDYDLFQGYTGTARIEVDDSNAITDFNDVYDIFLYRYDKDEQFVEAYNLRDPNNYTIDWAVTNALGNYATVELMLGYQTNYADFNDDGTVNLIDYSVFANNWLKTEAGLQGDLNADGTVDYTDLGLFVNEWLWIRGGGRLNE